MMKPRVFFRLLIGSALVFLTAHPVLATNRTVTNVNDSGAGSLRDTIAASTNGDTIDFSVTGIITLTSGQLAISKSITINGPGASVLTVQRSTAGGTPDFRIFEVGNGSTSGPTVTLGGLTVSNGKDVSTGFAGTGGGINHAFGVMTIHDCVVTGNQAREGGGIEHFGGSMTVQNCTISGNIASVFGGGIHSEAFLTSNSNLTVDNCKLVGNTAGSGGGIANTSNGATTTNPNASVTVTNSTLSGNSASSEGGGGMYCFGFNGGSTTATVLASTLDNNSATSDGGGIFNHFGVLTVTSSTLSGNSASSQGGGIWTASGAATLTMRNCTLSGNNCSDGGGIKNRGAALSLGSTILKSGSAGLNLDNDLGGTVTSVGYNMSDDNGGGLLTAAGDQPNTDPKLDPAGLLNNGGPTKTIALTSGSMAIDHGNSFGQPNDQRNFARIFDNPAIINAIGGDGSDIGAFEATGDPVQSGPALVVTTPNDYDDGTCGGTDCTLREAVARANTLPGANTITFANGVTGTITLAVTSTIADSTTITGPGARLLAISGNEAHRVFFFTAGTSAISGLTIRGGWEAGNSGSGVSRMGGGIHNLAALTVSDCAFYDNYVSGANNLSSGGPGGAGQGGGIYNGGTLTLNRCTFNRVNASGNIAAGGGGGLNSNQFGRGGAGGAGQGGAVFNNAGCILTINNCTFSQNVAAGQNGGNGTFGGNGGAGSGGAIFNLGTMTITAATVSGNTGSGAPGGFGNNFINDGAPGAGRGGLAAGGGTNTLRNTLSAGNIGNNSGGKDVDGAFSSGGYNLIGSGDHSTGFTATGDQVGTDAAPLNAQLGPSQNNGGPTDTMALLTGSPAIDGGKSFGLTIDQRSLVRPIDALNIANASGGDSSDIGAVEVDVTEGGSLFVTTTADHDDTVCSFGDCTLREAINAANAASGADTITFAPGLTGTITLQAALGQLPVTDSTTITGPGARVLAVSGGASVRVFNFSGGTCAVSGLTIYNGASYGSPGLPGLGGGVSNRATLTVNDCAFSTNFAFGGDSTSSTGGGGGVGQGGAVYNFFGGILTLNRCTFSTNGAVGGTGGTNSGAATHGGNGGAAEGAAVYNDSGCTLTINSCTFAGNDAGGGLGGNDLSFAGGNGGAANGAGVFNRGTMTATSCTLSNNNSFGGGGGNGNNFINHGASGLGSGGGLRAGGGTSTVRNTMSAGNNANGGGKDVDGAFSSGGYNLLGTGDHSSGFAAIGDQFGTDAAPLPALLGSFGNHGGPTDTLALTHYSPALDQGKNFGLTIDQRGQPRPIDVPIFANASSGDGSDIGAVEMNLLGGPDTDSDGMPDDFEIFFGLTDPNGDADGDGMSNLDEFKAGTDPLNVASALRITAVARNGNDFTLTFSLAIVGKSYRLERKDALTDANWSSIAGVADLAAGANGSAQVTDPGGASTAKRFYHIRVLP